MNKDLTNIIGYIYKITSPNNKLYIGQTINKKQRKYYYNSGQFKQQIKLWNNVQFYHWKPADTFEIIEECLCGENKVYLNEREQYWIQYYDSFKNGLNCNEGGQGNVGYTFSDESKIKMSKSWYKNEKENLERLKKLNVGRIQSEEAKEKKSIALLGIKRSDEFKEKMRIVSKDRIQSEETKDKIRKNKEGVVSKKRLKVSQIDLNNNLIKVWDHAGEAEIKLGITKGKISAVCLGNRKTTGGFKWSYSNE